MNAGRIIENCVYRVSTMYGGFLIEIPHDNKAELYRICAEIELKGYVISSVTEILPNSSRTPKVPVLTTKEFKAERKRQWSIKQQMNNKGETKP